MNLKDTINDQILGNFKIELIKNDKVIDAYEEHNQIQNPIFNKLSKNIYGNLIDFNKLYISGFAIGTDGYDFIKNEKKTPGTSRFRLYSEENFWDNSYSGTLKDYVYQVNFEKPKNNSEHIVKKISEGATYPAVGNSPLNYYGKPYNDPQQKEAGITIKRSYSDQRIDFDFYIGKYAANGIGEWIVDGKSPQFSEACFYLQLGRDSYGKKLGTIFSIKTFPPMRKTSECVIKISWSLEFKPTKYGG